MEISELQKMVAEGAALRRRQRLQPVGGPGDKLFPPTYPGEGRNAPPRHVYERRRLDGRDVWCVLIDSVQSQANRLEECLLEVIRDNEKASDNEKLHPDRCALSRRQPRDNEKASDNEKLPIPYVEVDFSKVKPKLDGITRITSLDAPHRVYDAIFRDSMLKEKSQEGEEDKPFMESAVGQRLAKASAEDASALLEISPTALLFGAWHSTGQGGGLGAKFARCLVSEIMGINVPVEFAEQRQSPTAYLAQAGERIFTVEPVTSARRPSSRIDPLGASSKVKIYRSATDENDWTADIEKAAKDDKGNPVLFSRKKGDKAGKPSIINHGNIKPSLQPLGVTCDYAEHSFVLSFAALRRLRFGESEKEENRGMAGARESGQGDNDEDESEKEKNRGMAGARESGQGDNDKDESEKKKDRDMAGRSLLAALGLVALTEQDARGYALRSRCDLVCDGRTPLELVHPDGATESVEINNETARTLYKSAFDKAQQAGFELSAEPLRLTPQDKLVQIVRRSQELALSGEGGEGEGESGGE